MVEESKEGSRLSGISEYLQFIFAMTVVVAFFLLLGLHFPADAQMGQTIFTGFIAWIGAIVGFYFGQKPVKDITNRLEEQIEKTTDKRTRANESLDLNVMLQEMNEGLKGENVKLKGLVENLTSSYEEVLDIMEEPTGE
ncbi:MAG: hypothetical protein KAR39_01390 [Thermoplasmata archaeon]|nr:hypothetical protein [Thermoplasmata archaeon]